jgi:hypothetical protein
MFHYPPTLPTHAGDMAYGSSWEVVIRQFNLAWDGWFWGGESGSRWRCEIFSGRKMVGPMVIWLLFYDAGGALPEDSLRPSLAQNSLSVPVDVFICKTWEELSKFMHKFSHSILGIYVLLFFLPRLELWVSKKFFYGNKSSVVRISKLEEASWKKQAKHLLYGLSWATWAL